MSLFPDHIIPSAERLAAHEVNYTPIGVVRQGLMALQKICYGRLKVRRFLDIGAGQGVWSKVVRELWPDCHITAVEIREEEREGLLKVADRVLIEPFAPGRFGRYEFDLAGGNPPFSQTINWVDSICSLEIAEQLLFFEKTQAFQRSVDGVELMELYAPDIELRIAQGVKCRTEGSGDALSYSHWYWDVLLMRSELEARQACPPSWKSYQLPLLHSSERRH